MIKFFRHIRHSLINQNKMGKYFKYAIGEIILVVIGILIALQINNWNSDRINKLIETEYLDRLKEETLWNIEQLNYNASLYLKSSKQINEAIEYIESDDVESRIVLDRPNYIHPWIIKESTYNELVSTGDLKIISDVPLRDLLDEVNSFAYFAEQQLQNWRNLANAHEPYFVPYKKSIKQKDTLNTDYYISQIDLNKLRQDSTAIELLKHWSAGNMVFYDGTRGLQEHFQKVLDRIDCLIQETHCPDVIKSIIKN